MLSIVLASSTPDSHTRQYLLSSLETGWAVDRVGAMEPRMGLSFGHERENPERDGSLFRSAFVIENSTDT